MSRRDYRQMTFADISGAGRIRKRKRLAKLDEMVGLLDWDRLDRLLDGINAAKRGGQGYPPLCMIKALLLAQWYDLSDPKLEDALADRLSFRRFCGFPLGEETPDETSFVRFRKRLREGGLYEKLFAEINGQLDGQGLVVRTGTLVDAPQYGLLASRAASTAGGIYAVAQAIKCTFNLIASQLAAANGSGGGGGSAGACAIEAAQNAALAVGGGLAARGAAAVGRGGKFSNKKSTR